MHLGHARTIAGPHHRANVVEGPHAIQDHADGRDGIGGGTGLLRHYPCRRIRSRISACASRACCDRDVGGLAPGRVTLLLPGVAGRAPNRAASASRVAGSSDTGGASGSSMWTGRTLGTSRAGSAGASSAGVSAYVDRATWFPAPGRGAWRGITCSGAVARRRAIGWDGSKSSRRTARAPVRATAGGATGLGAAVCPGRADDAAGAGVDGLAGGMYGAISRPRGGTGGVTGFAATRAGASVAASLPRPTWIPTASLGLA